MECDKTRAYLLCSLDIWSGLCYSISHTHPTAPSLLSYRRNFSKEVAGSFYFFPARSIYSIPNWFLLPPLQQTAFVKITKCHSNGHSFVFLPLNLAAVFHSFPLPSESTFLWAALSSCSMAQASASLSPDFCVYEHFRAQSWTLSFRIEHLS